MEQHDADHGGDDTGDEHALDGIRRRGMPRCRVPEPGRPLAGWLTRSLAPTVTLSQLLPEDGDDQSDHQAGWGTYRRAESGLVIQRPDPEADERAHREAEEERGRRCTTARVVSSVHALNDRAASPPHLEKPETPAMEKLCEGS